MSRRIAVLEDEPEIAAPIEYKADGFELCRQIRRARELTGGPVLFVTAPNEMLAVLRGAGDRFEKPETP